MHPQRLAREDRQHYSNLGPISAFGILSWFNQGIGSQIFSVKFWVRVIGHFRRVPFHLGQEPSDYAEAFPIFRAKSLSRLHSFRA